MRFAELEPYRRSALGKYIAQSMSHAMEAIRLIGMIVMAFGAWHRSLWRMRSDFVRLGARGIT
jgi:hypothetical protein